MEREEGEGGVRKWRGELGRGGEGKTVENVK